MRHCSGSTDERSVIDAFSPIDVTSFRICSPSNWKTHCHLWKGRMTVNKSNLTYFGSTSLSTIEDWYSGWGLSWWLGYFLNVPYFMHTTSAIILTFRNIEKAILQWLQIGCMHWWCNKNLIVQRSLSCYTWQCNVNASTVLPRLFSCLLVYGVSRRTTTAPIR